MQVMDRLYAEVVEMFSDVSKKGGILLANSELPKFVYPICLLGRQKSLENLHKKKYC
jgi:hypothetical protein